MATDGRSTFDPDVDGGGNGKDKQEQNEHERFHVVRCHSLHTKQDRSEQFALRSVKPMSQNVRYAAIVCGCTPTHTKQTHTRTCTRA